MQCNTTTTMHYYTLLFMYNVRSKKGLTKLTENGRVKSSVTRCFFDISLSLDIRQGAKKLKSKNYIFYASHRAHKLTCHELSPTHFQRKEDIFLLPPLSLSLTHSRSYCFFVITDCSVVRSSFANAYTHSVRVVIR